MNACLPTATEDAQHGVNACLPTATEEDEINVPMKLSVFRDGQRLTEGQPILKVENAPVFVFVLGPRSSRMR